MAVHSAGISETRGAHIVLIRLFLVLPHLLKILVDGGYKQGVIDWGKAMFGDILEVVKRPDLHTFKVLPKRWIVERTFGWFNWYRRLSKDYEHNPATSEAMIHFIASSLIPHPSCSGDWQLCEQALSLTVSFSHSSAAAVAADSRDIWAAL